MSVNTEITRIKNNISSAYTAVSNKGGIVPTSKTTANLSSAINSIATSTALSDPHGYIASSKQTAAGAYSEEIIIPSNIGKNYISAMLRFNTISSSYWGIFPHIPISPGETLIISHTVDKSGQTTEYNFKHTTRILRGSTVLVHYKPSARQ